MAAVSARRLIVVGVLAVLLIAIPSIAYLKRDDIRLRLQRATLPEAQQYHEVATSQPTSALPSPRRTTTPAVSKPPVVPSTSASVKPEINLAVPFTAQAPYGKWEPPYKEFCEEASVLMAVSYLNDEAIPTAAVADQKMLAIKAFEEKRFGYYEDTTAAETATILREFYNIEQVKLVTEPTVTDIQQAVTAGKLVIVPAAGRLLGNPYFTPPGPLYHMLVIKGYTADGKFITNDPGTRRGADFVYSAETIMNAMHDWRTDGNIEAGRKVVIVVG